MKEGREKLKEGTASVEEVTDKTGQFIPSTCLGDRMQMLEDTVLKPALTNGSTVALYLLFVPRQVVDGAHGCCLAIQRRDIELESSACPSLSPSNPQPLQLRV